MIGQLLGIILEKQPPQVLLDVKAVVYEIDAPMSTFYRLPEIGQEVKSSPKKTSPKRHDKPSSAKRRIIK